jgi:nitrogen fixation/metabolism regulation signal transduction histidine kinase
MIENCIDYLPISVTIADAKGEIVYMNKKAEGLADPPENLTGKNLFDCHSEASNEIMRQMLTGENVNAYTIEKKGVKKLIWQATWRGADGNVGGIAEISIPLAENMPHKIRE